MKALNALHFRLTSWLTFAMLLGCLGMQSSCWGQAVQPDFAWGRSQSAGVVFTNNLAVDAQGNAYTIGAFQGTADFDPGPGTFMMSSGVAYSDMYISKMNAAGDFVWARKLTSQTPGNSDQPVDIFLDSLGFIYIAGSYWGSVDFDPGPGIALETANASAAFLCKLDTSGSFVWVKSFATTVSGEGNAVTMDGDGNLLLVGSYTGANDFDPGPGTTILSSVAIFDAFLVKITPAGNLIWAKTFSGPGEETANGVAVDGQDNILIIGEFTSTPDVDPGPLSYLLTVTPSSLGSSHDIFVLKLLKNGTFAWAYSIGSPHNDEGLDIAVTSTQEVYTTGGFFDSVDFNTGPGTDTRTSQGYIDAFVHKVDSNGKHIWVKTIGGINYDRGVQMVLDAQENVLYTGHYRFNIDLDPGAGTTPATAIQYGIFMSKLNPAGNFEWGAGFAPNALSAYPGGIGVTPQDRVYINGEFFNTIDFDPSPQVNNLVGLGRTSYLCKYRQCIARTSVIFPSTCGNYTAPDGQVYTQSGTYTSTIPNYLGCDSIITIHLTVHQSTSAAIAPVACGQYTAPDGQVYQQSGNYIATIPNQQGCDSIISIQLIVANDTSYGAIAPISCGTYTAPDGQVYAQSGTYTAMIASQQGCDSLITIELTVLQSSASTLVASACDSFIAPDGQVYYTSGNYTCIIPNQAGCDSTIALQLQIAQSTTAIISPISCDNYEAPDGRLYSASGNYTARIPNAVGCDSTITINLTIVTVDATVTNASPTLIANQSGAQYQWLDCDNAFAPIPGATSQSFTATTSGNFAVSVTVGPCMDVSPCETVNTVGFAVGALDEIQVFPNPSNGKVWIMAYEAAEVVIFDCAGRSIARFAIDDGLQQLDLSALTDGIYLIHVNAQGQSHTQKLLIAH